MKTFNEFITEARNRPSQLASKRDKRQPKPGPKSKQEQKPFAVVTVGKPASGKSALAKHEVAKGNTDQHELDNSRKKLGKGPAYFGPDIVQHTYDGARRSAEQGRNTVLSNTSIPRAHRQDAINRLHDVGYEKVIPILAPGTSRAADRRNRRRTGTLPGEGPVPKFAMRRMGRALKRMKRSEKRELRRNYKQLHKTERFTKPAMMRSGAIRRTFR